MTVDLTVHRNLGEAFLARAAADPGRTAFTVFRGSTAATHESQTYAELAARTQARAAGLADRLGPGERVVIALPTGPQFVETYLSCLLSGLVAVPAPAPGGSAVSVQRLATIAADCSPGLVVTTGGDCAAVAAQLLDRGLGPIPVEDAAAAGPGRFPPAGPDRPAADPDSLAVIQYSSGSTGSPRGVMLAHGDVLANLGAANAYGVGPRDVFGSWLPLHHDFGLFFQLTAPLMFGSGAVLMAPANFVRRPVEWLRMLSEFECTVTSAPNFAFDLCLRLIKQEQLEGVDLSRLRFFCNGSEPVHPPLLAAFAKRFAAAGLRPEALAAGYGMAEATVYVSGTAIPREPTVLVADLAALESAERPELRRTAGPGREIVSVGRSSRLTVRIVDPVAGRVLPEGRIGEIWLRGPGVGRGYWNRPQLSAEIFRARPTESEDPGDLDTDWLRSGDLGAIVDADLYVTGRIKEVLIVRGRNLFPQDLEQQARAAHPALVGLCGAAFGVAAPDERIVLIHEVDPRTPAEELPVVASTVAKRLNTVVGVPLRNILLVRRGTVLRTTSGKIQRTAMRERFLAGAVKALYADLEPDMPKPAPAADAG